MTSTYPFFPKMVFKVFPLIFWLMIILAINRNMPLLVKMRVQPSLYNQRFSQYEFQRFGTILFFWSKKWHFYRVADTQLFFGNKQHPNDVKKHI